MGARRACAGRSWAATSRLGGHERGVLVTSDRWHAGVQQGGAGHPEGARRATSPGWGRCRRSWCGIVSRRTGRRPADRDARVLLRSARGRLGDPWARDPQRIARLSARTGHAFQRRAGSRVRALTSRSPRRVDREGQHPGPSHDPRVPAERLSPGAPADAAAAGGHAGHRSPAGAVRARYAVGLSTQ